MPSDSSKIINSFPADLLIIKTQVYESCGFKFSHPSLNTESKEYGACSFKLNGKTIIHRLSKITPTKNGQFVTIWKRNKQGITEPFSTLDELDFIIITVKNNDQLGQFIFPKSILADKGIISHYAKEGKRGIRVYPPWDIVLSKQAEKTQAWQLNYFLPIKNRSNDLLLAKTLLQPGALVES
ncbi:MAG: hypothetical protein K0S32_4265 [Bacteroidetes bacterium]|jgi:hypothetical protein|nr:hypothetical protein [Bacteroidota bacterium]